MNSLGIFLVISIITCNIITTLGETSVGPNSECEMLAIQKNCNSCKGGCYPVKKDQLGKWTKDVSNVLTSEVGVTAFGNYLRACKSFGIEYLDFFKQLNAAVPDKIHSDTTLSHDDINKGIDEILIKWVQYMKGEIKLELETLRHYIWILQNYSINLLSEDYTKFKQKLQKDLKKLGDNKAFVCRF